MSFRDFKDKVKRYAEFSPAERLEFYLTAIIMAFALSWNKWGTVEFDLWVGLANVLIALIMSLVILGVHHGAQRVWGINQGFKVEHKIWWYGAGIAFVTALLSKGSFVILALTGTFITSLNVHRLGRYRYGPQVKDFAMIALMGPLAVVVLGGFIKSLQLYTPLPLPELMVNQFFVLCMAFAAWNLFPLPPLDGSRIIFASRLLYAFVIGAIVSYVLLIRAFNVYSWIWALVIGVVTWFVFYVMLERKT